VLTRSFSAWYQERVLIDPNIQGGTPCIAGTQFPFKRLANYESHYNTFDDFISAFYALSREAYFRTYPNYITEEDWNMAKWYRENLKSLE
jgi:uncharacterized protein (DUF433 family)